MRTAGGLSHIAARLCLVLIATALAAALWASPAAAQTRVAIDCPNGPPCQTNVSGHVDAVGSARLPWTASLVAPAGLCFKTTIANSGSDAPVKLSVIAPDGKVFRQVNSASASVVNAGPTINGWYTIEVDSAPPAAEQIFKVYFYLLTLSGCS